MDHETDEVLEADAVFLVGRVSGVRGRRIQIRVDKLKNGPHLFYRGTLVRNVGVGSYVKIAKGFTEMVAKVDGESVSEDRSAPADYGRPSDRVTRTLEVSLVGFLEDGAFQRGVRELPLLDNECFVLRGHEVRAVHDLADATQSRLPLGSVATEPNQPVWIDVDKFFSSHMGIFGNTGSGKSYTLTKLYYELFHNHAADARFADSRFLLIDFNGEYVDRSGGPPGGPSSAIIASPDLKHTYRLTTRNNDGDRLPMTEEALRDPMFWTVLLDATERTQAPFIRRVLSSRFWISSVADGNSLKSVIAGIVCQATKTNVFGSDRQTARDLLREIELCLGDDAPTQLSDLIELFSANLQFHSKQEKHYWVTDSGNVYPEDPHWDSLIKDQVNAVEMDLDALDYVSRIRVALVLQYYQDIVSGHSNREHLSPLIKRLHGRIDDIRRVVGVSDADTLPAPLTVVSLRDVNLDMRKIVPMLLCKQLYDAKKRAPRSGHLNLIIDEAHNILSTQSSRESDAWRDYRLETFEEIIKEGRKFRVFLTLASQRPHDISETIISQLHNYFLHRLINDMDVKAVEKAVAYLDAVSFESLPILATGTCVVAGVSTQVPVVVKVGRLPEPSEPDSRTLSLVEAWQGESEDEDD